LIKRSTDEVRIRVGAETPVVVFMYHSVHPDADKGWGPWQYAVTPDQFRRQLGEITARYDVRPLSRVVESSTDGRRLNSPTAVITFDDGFRDALTEALPILARYEVPATVFVAGRYLDGPPPYEYRLAAALESVSDVSITVGETTIDRELTDDDSRQAVYERLHGVSKFARRADRERVVCQIDGTTAATPPMLTTEELTELDAHPLIDIGAHGYEHVPLTILDEREARSDIERSKLKLERRLGQEVTQFSYPYGAHSESVVAAVKRSGFRAAVTTRPRRIVASDIARSRFRIPRIDAAGRT
jgi:peptidoglycan/xylan/chitin deacetylase (PgdA/CDA1 family)